MSEQTGSQPPSATATAEQVIESLFARHAKSAPIGNERQHPRVTWITKLTIWIRQDRRDLPRVVQVKTQDVSRGGFSFLHSKFLHSDTLVSTRFDSLPEKPIVTGVIKSCVYTGDGQHRVGVEFIFSPPLDGPNDPQA